MSLDNFTQMNSNSRLLVGICQTHKHYETRLQKNCWAFFLTYCITLLILLVMQLHC